MGQPVTIQLKLNGASGCWIEIKSQSGAGYLRCKDVNQPVIQQPTYRP